jgi:hypothetical protein
MEYARLGSSGLKVSRICLGMMSYGAMDREWHLFQDAAEAVHQRAFCSLPGSPGARAYYRALRDRGSAIRPHCANSATASSVSSTAA